MLLEVDRVSKSFHGRRGTVRAVRDVGLTIESGECFGLIGESGSGKSTLAGIIAGLLAPDSGTVALTGTRLDARSARSRRAHQRQLQMVFQDPRSSFDPRRSIGDSLREPLRFKLGRNRSQQEDAVAEVLERVGLPVTIQGSGLHSVSVGQAQRVAIARALLAEPALIICDEITSALDATVRASILELLAELQTQQALSMLFISHDIAVVAQLAGRIAVMSAGALIEQGDTAEVISNPQHPYTRTLIEMA